MAELFRFKIERLKDNQTDPRQNIVQLLQAEDGTQSCPCCWVLFASYNEV